MDELTLKQNADFLSIALEEIDPDTAAYEFVEDVYESLLEEIEEWINHSTEHWNRWRMTVYWEESGDGVELVRLESLQIIGEWQLHEIR